jgi:putative nucleotidyltransferase with HDIG domain
MLDPLSQRARVDLCVEVPDGPPDLVIWEHTSRVARLAEAICGLPELSSLKLDHRALTAAALYHDIGWVLECRAGEISHAELGLRPTPELYLEMAADWMETNLSDLLPAATLQTAARAVRESSDRRSDLPEAQILADADNLDQIGPLTLCLMVRKQQAEGKTLDDVLAAWQRQEEYHYWQARIKECFRFASVRKLAERRWQMLRHFMADLRATLALEDFNAPAESNDVKAKNKTEPATH